MTFFQIFTSVVGIGFLIGGFLIFKNSRIWGVILILVGGWLMNNVVFGEISKSDDKQKEIQEIKSEQIDKIFILPSKRRQILTKDTLIINTETEIRKIQRCLSKTKETLRTNKSEDWGCILKIQKENQEIIFAGISKNGNQTILELYSEGGIRHKFWYNDK